jgi:hypothetical protein
VLRLEEDLVCNMAANKDQQATNEQDESCAFIYVKPGTA